MTLRIETSALGFREPGSQCSTLGITEERTHFQIQEFIVIRSKNCFPKVHHKDEAITGVGTSSESLELLFISVAPLLGIYSCLLFAVD